MTPAAREPLPLRRESKPAEPPASALAAPESKPEAKSAEAPAPVRPALASVPAKEERVEPATAAPSSARFAGTAIPFAAAKPAAEGAKPALPPAEKVASAGDADSPKTAPPGKANAQAAPISSTKPVDQTAASRPATLAQPGKPQSAAPVAKPDQPAVPFSAPSGQAGQPSSPAKPAQPAPLAPAAVKPLRPEPQAAPPASPPKQAEIAEPQFGRRDAGSPGAPRRPTQTPSGGPAPVGKSDESPLRIQPAARAASPVGEVRAKTNGAGGNGAARPTSLPPAEVPWPEVDIPESPATKGSRVEPRPPLRQPGAPLRHEAAGGKKVADPAITLGDLAERLEEALAREVQAANQARSKLDLDLEAFSFEATVEEQSVPKSSRTTEKPSADADTKREPRNQSERLEEAPVISLQSRRREAVDPLEDEMARLLGELTGDTSRR
jgi:hypothetical protein